MTFYKNLDAIMKQDFGNRGLLSSLPDSPLEAVADTLSSAKRAVLLTGFPVRLEDGSYIGETDGPSGTANLAYSLTELGCTVSVITDAASYPLLKAALSYRAPLASLFELPSNGTDSFIKAFLKKTKPTHFISLECPGKAMDGHYHNMKGEVIDDMLPDSASFLTEAKHFGAVTLSIGDGGNEMGMGFYKEQITHFVPSGSIICSEEAADLVLVSGVSNWWGWGIASILSHITGHFLLPAPSEETELLKRVVKAGGVDGCTKKRTLTVDSLPLDIHLSVLRETSDLTMSAKRMAILSNSSHSKEHFAVTT